VKSNEEDAMIDTRAVGQELQDLQHQIAGRIRKGQQTVAGTIRTLAHTAQAARPKIPALPMTALTDKLPSPEKLTIRLPKPEDLTSRLPKPEDLAARLPKPEALIAGAYDLAEQVLAAQRRLAVQVTHAALPLARQGAAMFGQRVSQSAWSTARTSRPAASATASSASAKATQAKPTATAAKAPKPAATAAKAPKPAATAAKAPKASTAGTSTKGASAKPGTAAGGNSATARKPRSAKK